MYNVKAVKLHTKGYHRCCKGISLGLLVEFCCVEITTELSGLFNTASGPASGCLGLCWGGSFPGPAWARAWSVVSSQLSGYTCSHLGTLAGQLCLPHVASLPLAGYPGLLTNLRALEVEERKPRWTSALRVSAWSHLLISRWPQRVPG